MRITPEYQRILENRKKQEKVRAHNQWVDAMYAELNPPQDNKSGWLEAGIVGVWMVIVTFCIVAYV